MNKKGFFLVFVLFLAFQMTGFSGPEEWALNVDIQPETPTINDSINIISSGVRGSDVYFENSFFEIYGTSLALDIYLHEGFLTVVTPWSHTENIGTLPAGTYDLTVTVYADYSPPEVGITSFDVVVPEPATFCFLALGTILTRRR